MRLIVLDESPWWGAAGKGLTERLRDPRLSERKTLLVNYASGSSPIVPMLCHAIWWRKKYS